MTEDEIIQVILRLSFKLHTKPGAGLLESVYKECLYYELIKEGLLVQKEKGLPVVYDEVEMPIGYNANLPQIV